MFQIIRDLVFTPMCGRCARLGSRLCPECLSTLVPFARQDIPGVESAFAAHDYDGWVRDAVIALKESRRGSVPALAELLVQLARHLNLDSTVACIPIPSSPQKLLQRGFNPVRLVADEAARISPESIRVANLLGQAREIDDSVGLNPRERHANVQGAFEVLAPAPSVVALIDDVITTGATLGSAAKTLKAAGVQEVYALALCASRPKGLR